MKKMFFIFIVKVSVENITSTTSSFFFFEDVPFRELSCILVQAQNPLMNKPAVISTSETKYKAENRNQMFNFV